MGIDIRRWLHHSGIVNEPLGDRPVTCGSMVSICISTNKIVGGGARSLVELNPGGAMIKRAWVRRYDQLPTPGQIVQSWDVANKQGEENDYSVCTTWLIHQNRYYYLIDVLRGRFDFPTLRTKVSDRAKLHKPSHILIEDAGFGTALIQELKTA
jgi:hypothetical protein